MIRLRKIHLGSAVLATLLWGACSDGSSLSGAGGKKSAKGDKKTVENSDDEGDQEDEKSDAPVQIAGAFLAADCALDPTAVPSALGFEVIGCAIFDKTTLAKTTLADAKLGEVLFNKVDGSRFVPVMQSAPAASRWHATTESDRGTFAAVKSIVASFDAGGTQHKLKSKPGEILGGAPQPPPPAPPDPATIPPPAPPAEPDIEVAGEKPTTPALDPESPLQGLWEGSVLEYGFDDWTGEGETGNWDDAGLCFHGPGLKFEDDKLTVTQSGTLFYRLAKDVAGCGHRARIQILRLGGGASDASLDSGPHTEVLSQRIFVERGEEIRVDFLGIHEEFCNPGIWKPSTDRRAVRTKVNSCKFDYHFTSQGVEAPDREGNNHLWPPGAQGDDVHD